MGVSAEEAPWVNQLGSVIPEGKSSSSWMATAGQVISTATRVHPEEGSARQVGDVPREQRQWQAFEFAEQMEEGLAPGLTSSFLAPLGGNEAAEERLSVQRSSNMREYLLTRQGGEPLLLAVRDSSGERFDIYIARIGKPNTVLGPAFSLQCRDSSLKDWTLQSVRCECCEAKGRRSCGIRELARIRHYVEPLGEGKALCMDIDIPTPIASEQECSEQGGCAVWCSVCNGQQPEDKSSIVSLTSRRPKWSPKHRTLTLNFYGRCSMASAKNFQLELAESDHTGSDMKFLFGKVSGSSFVLDYRRPLSMIEAFAAALTTSQWK